MCDKPLWKLEAQAFGLADFMASWLHGHGRCAQLSKQAMAY